MLNPLTSLSRIPAARLTRVHHVRAYASAANASASEEDIKAAREWLKNFNAETIPRSIGDVSFSRASGPGGQNVNKVNSKATLTIPFPKLSKILPTLLHAPLRDTRFYKVNSDALLIQSDDSRKQSDNVTAAFRKLGEAIEEVGRREVPGETSVGQRRRVENLAKAANEGRLKMKKLHSNKKSARKGG